MYWRSFWGGERQITNEGVRKEKIERKKQIKKHSKNNIDNTASGEENEYN